MERNPDGSAKDPEVRARALGMLRQLQRAQAIEARELRAEWLREHAERLSPSEEEEFEA